MGILTPLRLGLSPTLLIACTLNVVYEPTPSLNALNWVAQP